MNHSALPTALLLAIFLQASIAEGRVSGTRRWFSESGADIVYPQMYWLEGRLAQLHVETDAVILQKLDGLETKPIAIDSVSESDREFVLAAAATRRAIQSYRRTWDWRTQDENKPVLGSRFEYPARVIEESNLVGSMYRTKGFTDLYIRNEARLSEKELSSIVNGRDAKPYHALSPLLKIGEELEHRWVAINGVEYRIRRVEFSKTKAGIEKLEVTARNGQTIVVDLKKVDAIELLPDSWKRSSNEIAVPPADFSARGPQLFTQKHRFPLVSPNKSENGRPTGTMEYRPDFTLRYDAKNSVWSDGYILEARQNIADASEHWKQFQTLREPREFLRCVQIGDARVDEKDEADAIEWYSQGLNHWQAPNDYRAHALLRRGAVTALLYASSSLREKIQSALDDIQTAQSLCRQDKAITLPAKELEARLTSSLALLEQDDERALVLHKSALDLAESVNSTVYLNQIRLSKPIVTSISAMRNLDTLPLLYAQLLSVGKSDMKRRADIHLVAGMKAVLSGKSAEGIGAGRNFLEKAISLCFDQEVVYKPALECLARSWSAEAQLPKKSVDEVDSLHWKAVDASRKARYQFNGLLWIIREKIILWQRQEPSVSESHLQWTVADFLTQAIAGSPNIAPEVKSTLLKLRNASGFDTLEEELRFVAANQLFVLANEEANVAYEIFDRLQNAIRGSCPFDTKDFPEELKLAGEVAPALDIRKPAETSAWSADFFKAEIAKLEEVASKANQSTACLAAENAPKIRKRGEKFGVKDWPHLSRRISDLSWCKPPTGNAIELRVIQAIRIGGELERQLALKYRLEVEENRYLDSLDRNARSFLKRIEAGERLIKLNDAGNVNQ